MGCGYTLTRVAEQLADEDFVAVVRGSESQQMLSKQFKNVVRLDCTDPLALAELLRNYPEIETVIDSVPPEIKGNGSNLEVISLAENLEKVMRGTKIKRLIYLSTTGVFGVNDGSEVTEATPANPQHPRAVARLIVEQRYQAIPSLALCILRLPAIYGADRGIATALKNINFKMIADGQQWSNRIHVEDLASLLINLLNVKVLPTLLAVADDLPALQSEVVDYFCHTLDLKKPGSISLEEAKTQGMYTRLSNQRVRNTLMKKYLPVLRYPTYQS